MKFPHRAYGFGVLLCGAAALIGQSTRDAYRQAYDVWQQAQANLERDAAKGGEAQIAQVQRAAAAASVFEEARTAYLKSSADQARQRRQFLKTASTRLSAELVPPAIGELAGESLQTVTRTIARFANDPDRGIQQLRQALDRERMALASLNESIQARQKAMSAAAETAAAVEQVRTQINAPFSADAAQLSQSVDQVDKERTAWADYYAKMVQAIQTASAPAPAAAPPAVAQPPVAQPAPAPSKNDVTSGISLPRYIGDWTFPVVSGIFHGMQPQTLDLSVREQNGRANGTLSGRFKLPPGSTVDPAIKLTFEGDFTATPSQRFNLVTSDGTQGTIELIPGPAFNLLEVNFQTDPKPNKIRLGNFILVKK